MKKITMGVFALALAFSSTVAFAGGELPSRKVMYREVPAPQPVFVQPVAPVVQHRGFFGTVVGYVTNVVCDVGDIVYQGADAVTGVVGFDLAGDNAVQ